MRSCCDQDIFPKRFCQNAGAGKPDDKPKRAADAGSTGFYEDDVHARVNPLAPIPWEFGINLIDPLTGQKVFYDDCFRYAGDLVDGDMGQPSDPIQEAQAPFIFAEPPVVPPLPEFPTDPTLPPGPGYIWRGAPGSQPGDPNGNFYNPGTGESLRPDLNHEPPIGPHYDYKAPDGNWYRWLPDGTMQLKGGKT